MHLYDVRAHTDMNWLNKEKTFWFKLRAEFLQLKTNLISNSVYKAIKLIPFIFL